ncbi:MAG TPA: hypothetical protein VI382_06855 [Candidatus Manganitrophaceae bacterium]|nr:hypothetical protein [Candidatus Manganitrophaceae bacterium]
MSFRRKSKWIVLAVLGLSFFTLSLANACMTPDAAPGADCCALPCRNVSSPELAKSYCHLSDQQRSLHAAPQIHPPALSAENTLSLIADSLKAPPLRALSSLDPNHPIQHRFGDLCILHRALLL